VQIDIKSILFWENPNPEPQGGAITGGADQEGRQGRAFLLVALKPARGADQEAQPAQNIGRKNKTTMQGTGGRPSTTEKIK